MCVFGPCGCPRAEGWPVCPNTHTHTLTCRCLLTTLSVEYISLIQLSIRLIPLFLFDLGPWSLEHIVRVSSSLAYLYLLTHPDMLNEPYCILYNCTMLCANFKAYKRSTRKKRVTQCLFWCSWNSAKVLVWIKKETKLYDLTSQLWNESDMYNLVYYLHNCNIID